MTTPKAILESWKLLKQSARRYAFEAIDQFGNLLVGFYPHNHVYVVNFILSSQQFNALLVAQFFQYISESIANLTNQYRAAIFDAPDDMHLELMHGMAARFQVVFHTELYGNQCQKLRKSLVKSVFSRGVTNSLIAGIQPAQGYQIPPLPKGRGLLW